MCRKNRVSKGDMKKFLVVSLFGASFMVAGCVPKISVHGYIPSTSAVESLNVGDSKESVLARLGEPTTRGLQGDNAWYYISSKVRQVALFAPKEIDRNILAITFSGDRIAAVEHFGLQDGHLVNFNPDVTVTDGRKLTFLEQFLGNVGNFSAENFIGGN